MIETELARWTVSHLLFGTAYVCDWVFLRSGIHSRHEWPVRHAMGVRICVGNLSKLCNNSLGFGCPIRPRWDMTIMVSESQLFIIIWSPVIGTAASRKVDDLQWWENGHMVVFPGDPRLAERWYAKMRHFLHVLLLTRRSDFSEIRTVNKPFFNLKRVF